MMDTTDLVIDTGNSRTKAALFRGGVMTALWVADDGEMPVELSRAMVAADRCIVCSTRSEPTSIEQAAEEACGFFMRMEAGTPVPLVNCYATPATLGRDRLAAAVGARMILPGRDAMIADFGTALTVDVVTADGRYLGGSISPGLRMRLRAMHEGTGCLPLLETGECDALAGGGVPASTREAMACGAVTGMCHEVAGFMRSYAARYPGMATIFTGGDAPLFEKRFKNTIFANIHLVLIGLNGILNYNATHK